MQTRGALRFDRGRAKQRSDLCEGYFELRALGPTAVKGLSEPVEVYEVMRARAAADAFPACGAARADPVRRARARDGSDAGALEQASAGTGRSSRRLAEAGTGKSRLFYEFKATLPDGCKVLEAYSVSHGKASAWLPVLELLRGYFAIRDADDAATAAREGQYRAGHARPNAREHSAVPIRPARHVRTSRSAGADGSAG